jgi:protein gp37
MSGKTGIQWTASDDGTPGYAWNPVVGCTRVSAGCDFCYAFQLHDQRHIAWKRGRWPDAPAQYHQPFSKVQLLPERLEDPLHWRKPRRVFVDSMADLFHPDVPDEFIRRVFAVMGEASQHTFQVLTKRPERMQRIVSDMVREGDFATLTGRTEPPFPWPNVWLGVSVEDQRAADERIPLLLGTPAAVRFLSCEPLLSMVNIEPWLGLEPVEPEWPWEPITYERVEPSGMHWVIIGGESGPHARPMMNEWARYLVDQCRAAGVAPFVKQLGTDNAKRFGLHDRHGGDMSEWTDKRLEGLDVREFPRVEGEVAHA